MTVRLLHCLYRSAQCVICHIWHVGDQLAKIIKLRATRVERNRHIRSQTFGDLHKQSPPPEPAPVQLAWAFGTAPLPGGVTCTAAGGEAGPQRRQSPGKVSGAFFFAHGNYFGKRG